MRSYLNFDDKEMLFTKIYVAAKQLDYDALKQVNNIDILKNNLTPAGLLAKEGNQEAVNFLLKCGASIYHAVFGASWGNQDQLLIHLLKNYQQHSHLQLVQFFVRGLMFANIDIVASKSSGGLDANLLRPQNIDEFLITIANEYFGNFEKLCKVKEDMLSSSGLDANFIRLISMDEFQDKFQTTLVIEVLIVTMFYGLQKSGANISFDELIDLTDPWRTKDKKIIEKNLDELKPRFELVMQSSLPIMDLGSNTHQNICRLNFKQAEIWQQPEIHLWFLLGLEKVRDHTFPNGIFFGKYCLTRPFVFSFNPRSHE